MGETTKTKSVLPPAIVVAAWICGLGLVLGCGSRSSLRIDDADHQGAAGAGGMGVAAGGGGIAGAGGEAGACAHLRGPEVLADGLDDATAVLVDDDYVYVTEATDAGRLVRVPKLGGAAVELLTGLGRPRHLAQDASHVYVSSPMNGLVMQVQKGGGEPTVADRFPFRPRGIAVAGDVVFWVEVSGVEGRLVSWVPGQAPNVERSVPFNASSMTADAPSVFWIDNSQGEPLPSIYRYDVDMDEMTTVTSLSASNGTDLVLDDSHVYATLNGEAVRAPRDGGTAARLAEGIFLRGLELDGDWLYLSEAGGTEPGRIRRLHISTGQGEALASGQASPAGIALDDSCVYWANRGDPGASGAVMKAPR